MIWHQGMGQKGPALRARYWDRKGSNPVTTVLSLLYQITWRRILEDRNIERGKLFCS
jgi:hypothetical protein